MTSLAQHDAFNSTSSSIFPHDWSSKNEIDALAREAAKREAERKKALQEAQALQDQCAKVPILEGQKKTLEARIRDLEAEVKDVEMQKNNLEATSKTALEAQARESTTALSALQTQILDYWHQNSFWSISLTAEPHTAIDVAGGNWTYPHSWERYGRGAQQELLLQRTNPADPESPWRIGRDGLWLEFMNDTDLSLSREYRTDTEGKKAQEWWIRQTMGISGYTIQNTRNSLVIEMERPTENVNG
ncbi:hypothetical protein B0H63DRAFT_455832 [Podospora didyma]|uniref:Uncharacterized protein n=1 Tax=Podospora didyma TaxID=330526 RepID=A0AAE0K0I2_9PEZI|nr:hypothetical protein B0H63DRAFT_455832 [Podospora didyma]